MRSTLALAAITMIVAFALSACSDGTPTSSTELTSKSLAYPLFADGNGNRINDYVEGPWHEGNSHIYADTNGDGVCDLAQDGSPAWHGPGFIDEDGNGTCDYWQEGSARQNRHEGLRYQDGNDNSVNDFHERSGHRGDGHPFRDSDRDGVCDFAQDGGPAWHGPGFIDEDGSGVCDRWEGGDQGPRHGN